MTTAVSSASVGALADIVTPGEALGGAEAFQCGSGVHVLAGRIYASITGYKQLQQQQPQAAPQSTSRPILSVASLKPPTVLPQPGDVVTARVVKINPRYASCSIVAVGRSVLTSALPGLIRQRDIRSFDVDNADVARSFRPGDLIVASVVSLGDTRSYHLSTAAAELGVLEAVSAAGHDMRPISWERMQCVVTGIKEYRKVAKVDGLTESDAAASSQ